MIVEQQNWYAKTCNLNQKSTVKPCKNSIKNICNFWVKYNINTFHIVLNTKRVTTKLFENIKMVKINSIVDKDENPVYKNHVNKESTTYKIYPFLKIGNYNDVRNNKHIVQGIVSIFVQKYSTMLESSVNFSICFLKPMIKLFCEFLV